VGVFVHGAAKKSAGSPFACVWCVWRGRWIFVVTVVKFQSFFEVGFCLESGIYVVIPFVD
jgi:hypothetical protein